MVIAAKANGLGGGHGQEMPSVNSGTLWRLPKAPLPMIIARARTKLCTKVPVT
jgi:hypothetical protein